MKIVIVGGGFGGLACAQKLGGSQHDVLVIDRNNHNLFQPLLYQVATAALSPGDIAEPIRKVLKRYRNISVVMANVSGVDRAARIVHTETGESYGFDVLVLATGSRYDYFGHPEWSQFAPGLKTAENARTIRGTLLRAFEKAEASSDPAEQQELMTTVIIGGGPTGVEMAGAACELGRWTLSGEFRNVEPAKSRVLLLEAADRILGQFPEKLSRYATEALQDLGVKVMTGIKVQSITGHGVETSAGLIKAGTIVWGAGVAANPAAEWLGIEADRGGRIKVNADLSVAGLPNVYALGDLASFEQDGKPLPGLAQVAKQQGVYLGRLLRNMAAPDKSAAAPFRFRNRGNTAVIGRHAAVFDFGKYQMSGRLAWFLWALVHVYLLVSFEKRTLVSLQWLWRYLTRARGVRLIP